MKGDTPPNSHELAKLESRIKLVYFLRDIGIIKTNLAAEIWVRYAETLSEIAAGGVAHDL